MRVITSRLPFVANRLPSLSMLTRPSQWKWLGAWFLSRKKDYLLDHAIPFITYDAAAYLRKTLKDGIRVFEYGSGASTLFWAGYAAQCVSIEHDPTWQAAIKRRLADHPTIDLRLVPPDPSSVHPGQRDVSDPDQYWTDWEAFASHTFQNYVRQIDAFPDHYFDVVLIDGQARPACLKYSYRKVKPGGLLILDNADVPRYLSRAQRYVTGFERLCFYGIGPINGVFSQTDIYLAPPEQPRDV